jgi:glycosyltransferase involved in cell wall biosynthesis
MRVGFTSIDERLWTGGYQYLLNLFQAIQMFEPDRVQPVLFHGDEISRESRATIQRFRVETIHDDAFTFANRTRFMDLAATVFRGINTRAAAVIRRSNVEVVFECARFFGRNFEIPAIAWIPDMQHRRMPEMFDRLSYWRREIGFRLQVSAGRTIVLSSEEARADCEKYYPRSTGRTHVVSFARTFSAAELAADPEAIRAKYDLPARFVYLPNQFWKHKNHQVVVEALGRLKRNGEAVVVAATGVLQDLRHAEHAQHIMEMVRRTGVESEFRVLGRIPYEDVIALMRAASAVLNPSLCEGWSTTVEEAKALGVPLMLSAIGVHFEQARDGATFFDPRSSEDLAGKLLAVGSPGREGRLAREDASRGAAIRRTQAFAHQFCSVAEIARARSWSVPGQSC